MTVTRRITITYQARDDENAKVCEEAICRAVSYLPGFDSFSAEPVIPSPEPLVEPVTNDPRQDEAAALLREVYAVLKEVVTHGHDPFDQTKPDVVFPLWQRIGDFAYPDEESSPGTTGGH